MNKSVKIWFSATKVFSNKNPIYIFSSCLQFKTIYISAKQGRNASQILNFPRPFFFAFRASCIFFWTILDPVCCCVALKNSRDPEFHQVAKNCARKLRRQYIILLEYLVQGLDFWAEGERIETRLAFFPPPPPPSGCISFSAEDGDEEL